MKGRSVIMTSLFVLGVACSVAAQTGSEPATVRNIRKIYTETNERIAAAKTGPSDLFVAEIQTNLTDNQFPAVGTYRPVIRFIYTYGDREKNPYPDRLVKVAIEIDRSARKELTEFLFDESGRLIFYFEKSDEGERRLYLDAAKPVWILVGDKPVAVSSPKGKSLVRTATEKDRKMTNIFRSLLSF